MEDFHVSMYDKFIIDFAELNECYKNFGKSICIDIILTGKLSYFQQSNVLRLIFLISISWQWQNPKWDFKRLSLSYTDF